MKKQQQIDAAVNPSHYKEHPSGLEAIDVIENMPALLAMAAKYLFRLGKKDDALQELYKAKWYLERYRESISAASICDQADPINEAQENYIKWFEQGTARSFADHAIYTLCKGQDAYDQHLCEVAGGFVAALILLHTYADAPSETTNRGE